MCHTGCWGLSVVLLLMLVGVLPVECGVGGGSVVGSVCLGPQASDESGCHPDCGTVCCCCHHWVVVLLSVGVSQALHPGHSVRAWLLVVF